MRKSNYEKIIKVNEVCGWVFITTDYILENGKKFYTMFTVRDNGTDLTYGTYDSENKPICYKGVVVK